MFIDWAFHNAVQQVADFSHCYSPPILFLLAKIKFISHSQINKQFTLALLALCVVAKLNHNKNIMAATTITMHQKSQRFRTFSISVHSLRLLAQFAEFVFFFSFCRDNTRRLFIDVLSRDTRLSILVASPPTANTILTRVRRAVDFIRILELDGLSFGSRTCVSMTLALAFARASHRVRWDVSREHARYRYGTASIRRRADESESGREETVRLHMNINTTRSLSLSRYTQKWKCLMTDGKSVITHFVWQTKLTR